MAQVERSRRVVLAEADRDVRSALALLLTHALGLEVAGEADEIAGLLRVLDAAMPDLLLLDWGLAERQGERFLPAMRDRRPELRIVALSGRAEVGPIALAAGADAFICKADSPEQALRVLTSLGIAHAATDSRRDSDSG